MTFRVVHVRRRRSGSGSSDDDDPTSSGSIRVPPHPSSSSENELSREGLGSDVVGARVGGRGDGDGDGDGEEREVRRLTARVRLSSSADDIVWGVWGVGGVGWEGLGGGEVCWCFGRSEVSAELSWVLSLTATTVTRYRYLLSCFLVRNGKEEKE